MAHSTFFVLKMSIPGNTEYNEWRKKWDLHPNLKTRRNKWKIKNISETYPQIPPVLISNPPSKSSPSSVYAGFAIVASCWYGMMYAKKVNMKPTHCFHLKVEWKIPALTTRYITYTSTICHLGQRALNGTNLGRDQVVSDSVYNFFSLFWYLIFKSSMGEQE